jgi:hypothetical protein
LAAGGHAGCVTVATDFFECFDELKSWNVNFCVHFYVHTILEIIERHEQYPFIPNDGNVPIVSVEIITYLTAAELLAAGGQAGRITVAADFLGMR